MKRSARKMLFIALSVAILATAAKHLYNREVLRFWEEAGLTRFFSSSMKESKEYGLFLDECLVSKRTLFNESNNRLHIESVWIEKGAKRDFQSIWFFRPQKRNAFSVAIRYSCDNSDTNHLVEFSLENSSNNVEPGIFYSFDSVNFSFSSYPTFPIHIVVKRNSVKGILPECESISLEPPITTVTNSSTKPNNLQ